MRIFPRQEVIFQGTTGLIRLTVPAHGMSIGGDLRHFLRAGRAADSFAYVTRRVLRQASQTTGPGAPNGFDESGSFAAMSAGS